jgi:azurin
MRVICALLLTLLALPGAEPVFERGNLVAWCIVPFDAKKRGPEERAAMLARLGLRRFVYDYRAEHVPQWDAELAALKKQGIKLEGWWFPTTLNDEAKAALALFRRHDVHPQLWVMGQGGPVAVKDAADQRARVAAEVARLKPICEAGAAQGCPVALYNHGGWFGRPENLLAVVEALRAEGVRNVGVVFNLHHAHDVIERFDKFLPKLLPYLLCLNLNGMDADGEAVGRKIKPLGTGHLDLALLRQIRASGYRGPIGLLNHTDADAEGRLQDNLDGLAWLVAQLDAPVAPPAPSYRTWKEPAARRRLAGAHAVPSLSPEFGSALAGGLLLPGKPEYHAWPITVECRARLDGKADYNVLIACNHKAELGHWEFKTDRGTGAFGLYIPGRGGEFPTGRVMTDGRWHDYAATIGVERVRVWIDGELVLDRPLPPETKRPAAKTEQLAFGRLVDGSIGCDGVIDEVRLSRGETAPVRSAGPRSRGETTLGLWSFEEPFTAAPVAADFRPAKPPLYPEETRLWKAFVNRDRIYDFYAKQARAFGGREPRPALLPEYPGLDGGLYGHQGNQNDQVTWRDRRWEQADKGSLFSGVFRGEGLTVPKAVCVREGDRSACFDPVSLTFPLEWRGGFVQLGEMRHGFNDGGRLLGQVVQRRPPAEPAKDAVYHGFYRHGSQTVFSYTQGGRDFLATAWSGPQPASQLAPLTKGGPAQWPTWIETVGTVGAGRPFATDTIAVPFANPYGALMFLSGLDFLPDGTAAVATMTGEVWLVRGLDAELRQVRWKRFATGLHQPLGVKVVGGRIHVLGRDQVTRLHDLNGDDEADFYECVTNGYATSQGGHDYVIGLEADAQGRFYTSSGNQGMLRLAGAKGVEVLATGLRNPNGTGFSPDDRFFTSSLQEGNWTPASAIVQVELGKDEGAHFGYGGPKAGQAPKPPLLYLPRGEDNSSAGQVFLSDGAWPALRGAGNLVHLSFGAGSALMVTRQQVGGQWQGAAQRIASDFLSGAQQGRFNPKDGHLYVTGIAGWQTYTTDDGCLQRLRHVGGAPVLVAHEVRDNGVWLRFDAALDARAVGGLRAHFAQAWNYRYAAAYGSPEFSVAHPGVVGHDVLEVRSAHVLGDGREVFIEIPQLTVAHQVHLNLRLVADRTTDVFLTAHALAEPFKDFPGYAAILKIAHAHAAGPVGATSALRPVRWETEVCGNPPQEITLETATGLQFAQKELRVKAGRGVALTVVNPDSMPHNWVLTRPNALEAVTLLSAKMAAEPDAYSRHYVPETADILCHTRLIDAGKRTTVYFNAPKEPGRYPYLCTFPGHAQIMRGVLIVE